MQQDVSQMQQDLRCFDGVNQYLMIVVLDVVQDLEILDIDIVIFDIRDVFSNDMWIDNIKLK